MIALVFLLFDCICNILITFFLCCSKSIDGCWQQLSHRGFHDLFMNEYSPEFIDVKQNLFLKTMEDFRSR